MFYTRKTSDLYIHQDLVCVLKKIENDSVVAKLLLKSRHQLENLVQDHVNYISISQTDPTKISYLTKDRIEKFKSGEWNIDEIYTSQKRFMIKPGAFVSKIFKGISLVDVEKFSTLFKNIQDNKKKSRFRVVSGEEIVHYYHHKNYASEDSSLGKSCMKHDHSQMLFSLYQKNPNQVKMLVMVNDEDKLIGRALLWESNPKVMDRIYTIDDANYSWDFKRWADQNGYMYKKEQKHNNTLYFTKNAQHSLLKLSLKIENSDFTLYPYMDTFKFYNEPTKTLYNYIPSDISVITLITTLGKFYSGTYLGLDNISNLFERSDNLVYLEYLNIKTVKENCVYSDIYKTHILRSDAQYIEKIDDYIFEDNQYNDNKILERIFDSNLGVEAFC